ncbi:MAG: ABC transporter ATP-binding protein [Desulfovibrio sp.]
MIRPLLQINDLSLSFGDNKVVQNVDIEIQSGETHALVGESGSGKSLTARAIIGLLPPEAIIDSGEIHLEDTEILSATDAELCALRGSKAAMIFQEPRPSLNPLHTVEKYIGETLKLHMGYGEKSARIRALELLDMVGIDSPEQKLSFYPHELSGGQCQRVMIASALAGEPRLLIADEPTTALDVTVQRQILELMNSLTEKLDMATLFISHDLRLVRRYAQSVSVMYNGKIVEHGKTQDIFDNPQAPNTCELLAINKENAPIQLGNKTPQVLNATDIAVWFPVKKGLLRRSTEHLKAVDGVSLTLSQGECLGVVGESGSGKTTLGLALLKMIPSRGSITIGDTTVDSLKGNALRSMRKRMQMVFQDPFGSLSPRMSIEQIIEEGLRTHTKLSRRELAGRVEEALIEVGLSPDMRNRYPHEFSGGQRQRIAIARALTLRPDFLILDEPTSSLDRTVQFSIIELLRSLQRKYGLSYIFITHDLHLTRMFCHRVLVMKAGRIVESGITKEVFEKPETEYTKTLLTAADL